MLKMRTSGIMRAAPQFDAQPVKLIDHTIELEAKGTENNGFIEVDARFPTTTLHGFVIAVDVVEIDATKPVPTDLWSFVQYCSIASRAINDGLGASINGVSRDYIIALALVLNDLENEPNDQDQLIAKLDIVLQAFDPFRFTEKEWDEFIETFGSRNRFVKSDRVDPIAQLDAAVFRTFESIRVIEHSLTNALTGSGPYVPNSIDLFLVHMLGSSAGIAILKDLAVNGDRGSKPLSSFVDATGGDIAALKQRYPKFLGVPGKTSVDDIRRLIETHFDEAYIRVARILLRIVPEELPDALPTGTTAPWLTVAENEEARGVAEPNQRILEYFKATPDKQSPTTNTPWCGAFVAFCLKQSGDPEVAGSVPSKGMALAASWKKWGRELPIGLPSTEIPRGAVVLLSPVTDDSSGHVGFFVGGDPNNQNRVVLLGGNQSDAVKKTPFLRSRVVRIGWPESVSGTIDTAVNATEIKIGPFTTDDWNKYCEVLGHRESSNNYGAINRLGYCGRWQFGAAALIDVGYVRRGRVNKNLGDPRSWLNKNGINSRDAWLMSKDEQDKAMLEFTRLYYRSLVRLKVLNSQSPKTDVAGFLAAAHLTGPGGAKDLKNGIRRADANGVTAQQYFDLLARQF